MPDSHAPILQDDRPPGRLPHTLQPRRLRGWLTHALLAGLLALAGLSAVRAADLSSIVFYYGEGEPATALTQFRAAVVEPEHGYDPTLELSRRTRWIAYVSVGEVLQSRSYYRLIPPDWLIGHNATWQSRIIDQSAPGWPEFFVSHIARPLWKKGYRGLFLDTLDSYEILSLGPDARQRQREGLVRLIRALRQALPRATLIMNRGFELLPQVHDAVDALAFESLYRGWDEASGRYTRVPQDERTELLDEAAKARRLNLQVIAIDYCNPRDAACTRETAARIREHGITPYVGDGHLQFINRAMLP